MIAYLGEWIKHIVLLILIATFMDLLLPSSHMRRYVRMVIGLLVMMVILSPILDLLKFDQERMLESVETLFEEEQLDVDLEFEKEQEKMEHVQEEAIIRQTEHAVADEIVLELRSAVGRHVADVHVEMDLNTEREELDIVHVLVYMDEEKGTDEETSEVHAQQRSDQRNVEEADHTDGQHEDKPMSIEPVEPVEPVIIESVQERSRQERLEKEESEKHLQLQDKVLTYLQDEWNISVDKISFQWTGR